MDNRSLFKEYFTDLVTCNMRLGCTSFSMWNANDLFSPILPLTQKIIMFNSFVNGSIEDAFYLITIAVFTTRANEQKLVKKKKRIYIYHGAAP